MKVLVINAGSSSLKYQLIDMADESVIAKGICERVGTDGACITYNTKDGGKITVESPMKDHTEAFGAVKKALTEGENKVIDDISEIAAVGHRVVQGGSLFNKSVLINDDVIAGIEGLNDLAPLHNPANIMGINASIELFGKEVPQVAVFDNAFHSTMPAEAYTFPVPYELAQKHSIRRYGFHGTSHKFVSSRCAEVMGKNIEDLKIITCHLGNGSSITAVKNGKVIDTTMGLTPLDGVIMGTRCGNIDPSVVLFLMEKENLSIKEMDTLLTRSLVLQQFLVLVLTTVMLRKKCLRITMVLLSVAHLQETFSHMKSKNISVLLLLLWMALMQSYLQAVLAKMLKI